MVKEDFNKQKKMLRQKKAAVFVLAFFLYIGLLAVDNAGSEMTGYPGTFALKAKRINSDYIELSFLGKETLVDTTAVIKSLEGTKKLAINTINNLYTSIKSSDNKIDMEDIQALMPGKTL